MRYVYLLKRHPRHPYGGGHLEAAVVVGVYADKAEPARIVAEKNGRKPLYLWTVQRRAVKS